MNTLTDVHPKAVVVPIAPAIELRRILYATDFSPASLAALPLVSMVAQKYRSEVLVAHVWEPLPYTMVTPDTLALEQRNKDEAKAKAKALMATPELSGLPVTAVIKGGSAAKELKWMVLDHNIDLAVVSTHGRTGFKHLMMGSVAEEVFRCLPCPVLAVGPNVGKRSMNSTAVRHILFPTDLSEASRAVFPYLALLASEYGASLTLLHVLPIETGANPDARFLAEPLREEMKSIFAPHIDSRCPMEFLIDFGETVERILAHAKAEKADLIGMGVRKAGGITTHLHNSVAYRVVLEAHCPVLTAREPE